MAYIGFDLDETLGRFATVSLHVSLLQPYTAQYDALYSGRYGTTLYNIPFRLTQELMDSMDNAFEIFANCIVEKEKENPPLGIIRPSMIELIKQLQILKEAGQVKSVVIYSNNGNIALLHLAGKVLEKLANAPGLFCNYIHWFHPFRHLEVEYGKPGIANKTLRVLKKAFNQNVCNPVEISEKDIYFFDDAVHPDLISKLKSNYIQVEPYKYDAEFAPLNRCFMTALKESGLSQNLDYLNYISPLLGGKKGIIGIMSLLENDEKTFRRSLVKPNNSALTQQVKGFLQKPVDRVNFRKAIQTIGKLEQKQNLGTILSEKEQDSLRTAQNIITAYEKQNPNSSGGRRKTKKRKSKN